jgi:hypothetical protein
MVLTARGFSFFWILFDFLRPPIQLFSDLKLIKNLFKMAERLMLNADAARNV